MKKLVGLALSTLVGTSFAIAETAVVPAQQPVDQKSQEVSQGSTATPVASTAPESDLEKAVIDLLDKKPELIVNAIHKYTERQQEAQQKKINEQLNLHKDALLDKSLASVIGDPQATTKLVIFLDSNCPHCRTFEKTIYEIQKTYPHVAFYLKLWPILGKDSAETAAALWAAAQQGKFDEISKKLIESSEKADGKKVVEWAKQISGLDLKKFETDMKSEPAQKVLEQNGKIAEQLGFQGTPTTIFVGKDGVLKLINPTDKESLIGFLKDGEGGEKHPAQLQAEAPLAPAKAS